MRVPAVGSSRPDVVLLADAALTSLPSDDAVQRLCLLLYAAGGRWKGEGARQGLEKVVCRPSSRKSHWTASVPNPFPFELPSGC